MLTRCEQEIYCDGAMLRCTMHHQDRENKPELTRHKTNINASITNKTTKLIAVHLEWITSC